MLGVRAGTGTGGRRSPDRACRAARVNSSPSGHVTAAGSALATSTDSVVGRRADTRRVAEHVLERAGVALDEPRLAVVVVHGERATGGEVVAVRLDGLLGEQVALEADRRLALQQRERVGEGEQDRVPLAVGLLEEGAAVGDVGRPRAGRRRAGRDARGRGRGGRRRSRRRRRGTLRGRWRRRRRCPSRHR